MNTSPFLRFIDLVTLDKKIHSILQKIARLDMSIAVVNKQRTDYAFLIEELSNKLRQLKKNVDMQELEMKVLDEKEREKKKRFDTLSDYKEYQALKNEVEAIQRLQIDQEKKVLEAWNQVENAQAMLERKKRENIDVHDQLDVELQTLIKEKEVFSQELQDIHNQRESQMIDIPQEWLEKYNTMGQKVENPVVGIEQGSCGGCFQQLIAQDLIRARRGALLQCRKCFRLLYLPQATEE